MRPGVQGFVSNYRLAFGVALYLFSSVFFVMGVAQGELTILYPMVSLGYIWTLLWAYLFFKEPFSRSKIFGLVLIVAGVFCINLGNATPR
jgi:multidrug transporter EmrE-like cation transporter